MKQYNVAILGATGAVGQEMMKILAERDFPVAQLHGPLFEIDLIQQQPVAKDLRTITAALKIVTDMERIGDQAADIGEITIKLANQPYIKKLEHINQMASETMLMLIRSIEAYVEKDMDKARKVIAYDDVVDDLFEKVRDDLIAMIQADSANGEQAADLLMVAKYFERIGDHATNIAEWVIFALDTKGGFDENASEHL